MLNTSRIIEVLTSSWFLAGPTACGKTAVSLLLASRLNAEIISLDSMAVYRGMDIGTAKPSADEQKMAVHHLIDVADPHQEFSVAEFVRMAMLAADDILSRQRIPLFVGGTGLYLRSVLRGLFDGPAADWELRHELNRLAAENGAGWLHQQLLEIDPISAERLHPNDIRRLIRAIEVFRLTGRKLSDDQSQQPRPPHQQPMAVVWLDPPREWLCERINRRVEQMVAGGWLRETQQLLDLPQPCSRTARQALGYRELFDVLEGRLELPAAIARIQTATRQFAKRQHTWFRNLQECRPLSITGQESANELCDRIELIARSSA